MINVSSNRPKKELEDFNFRLAGIYNVSKLISIVNLFKDEWNIYTSRQNEVYDNRVNPHLHTNTYIVQDHPLDWIFGEPIQADPKDEKILESISHIIEKLEEEIVGKSARVLLIKLGSKKMLQYTWTTVTIYQQLEDSIYL